jgi:hypothetical protein
MLSVKFIVNKADEEINRTVKNIVNFICEKINLDNTKILSDKTSTELIAGKEDGGSPEQVVVELLIRKHIVINNSDFKDREQLDKHIKKIEDLKYLPINMR